MLGRAAPLQFRLDPLIAEAKRRMRRRRVLIACLLVGALAVGTVLAATSLGGPGPTGPSGGQTAGTSAHAIERAFGRRGIAVAPAAALPELCDPSVCTSLLLWGGDRPAYLVPQERRDFAVVVFSTASAAHRLATFERTHSAPLGADVRGSTVLVYLRSSTSRIASARAALAALR